MFYKKGEPYIISSMVQSYLVFRLQSLVNSGISINRFSVLSWEFLRRRKLKHNNFSVAELQAMKESLDVASVIYTRSLCNDRSSRSEKLFKIDVFKNQENISS